MMRVIEKFINSKGYFLTRMVRSVTEIVSSHYLPIHGTILSFFLFPESTNFYKAGTGIAAPFPGMILAFIIESPSARTIFAQPDSIDIIR